MNPMSNIFLVMRVDIEENPGPNFKSRNNLPLCHWDLNFEDGDLTLNAYNLLPADYPSNVKRGGKF